MKVRSLTFRLTLGYCAVATLTMVAILVAGRYFLEASVIDGVDLLNKAEFEEIQSRVDGLPPDASESEVVAAIQEHTEIDAALYFFQLGHSDEDVFFRSANMGHEKFPPEVHGAKAITVELEEFGRIRVGEFDLRGMDLHIASPLLAVDALFTRYYRGGLILVGLVLLGSWFAGLVFSRLALSPVRAMRTAAEKIGASNLHDRLPVPSTGDEVAELGLFLNEMFSRLERSFNQIQRFTAEASHELRTPLSLIRLQVEKLAQWEESAARFNNDEKKESIEQILEEIGRLNKIIDDLLLLAKADAGVLELSFRSFDAEEFVCDFGEDAEALAEDRGIRFQIERSDPGIVEGDAVWLRHALYNLLANAIRVSASGSRISFISENTGRGWRWVMEDEGPGVAQDQLSYLFDRFFRIRPAEGEEKEMGSGLGLSIVFSVVQRHGGTVRAENRSDREGLRMIVELPVGNGE